MDQAAAIEIGRIGLGWFIDRRGAFSLRVASIRLVPSWRTLLARVEAAGEVLLTGPGARQASTMFDAWLARGKSERTSRCVR